MTRQTHHFLENLHTNQQALILKRDGQRPTWDDETLHQTVYTQQPTMYALMGVLSGVKSEQRARLLFQLLRQSRQDMTVDVRHVLDQVTSLLLAVLPADSVLTTFLAVRRERANHKHTRRAMLRYLLNHPALEDMASKRRPAVVDSLEHAMGRDVARACAKLVVQGLDEAYLRRHLLRFADDPQRVKPVLLYLYRWGHLAASEVDYQTAHETALEQLEPNDSRPKTVTATNRGEIAANLVHIYRGGSSSQLTEALEQAVTKAAAELPRFGGKVGLVLDASASMQGYGEREYCILAQSVALQKVLERCATEVEVKLVGGTGNPPQPTGPTDLATALIELLEGQPDVVAIVSDGYENCHEGDLAKVVATLPQIGLTTPIVFCHTKFTEGDDLTLRRPKGELLALEFWHQADFEGLLLRLFATAKQGQTGLQDFLYRRLDHLQKELPTWNSVN